MCVCRADFMGVAVFVVFVVVIVVVVVVVVVEFSAKCREGLGKKRNGK